MEKESKLKKILSNSVLRDKRVLIGAGVTLFVVLGVLIFNLYFDGDVMYDGVIDVDAEKFKNEYEKLNDVVTEDGKKYPEVKLPVNNLIKYSSIDQILNIFESKKDAVIYFGYPSCLYCRSAIQVLCDVASSSSLDAIYYLDLEKKDDKYNELLGVLDKKFTINEEGMEVYVPLVLFVANGEVVSYNKGTLSSQEDPYVKLDKDQVAGLEFIYSHGIQDVLDSMSLK